MKKYILTLNGKIVTQFETDNLRHWLINHIDLSENYDIFEFKCNTKK